MSKLASRRQSIFRCARLGVLVALIGAPSVSCATQRVQSASANSSEVSPLLPQPEITIGDLPTVLAPAATFASLAPAVSRQPGVPVVGPGVGRALAPIPTTVAPAPVVGPAALPAEESPVSAGGGASGGSSTGSSATPVGYLDVPSVGIATFVVGNGWSISQLNLGGAGLGNDSISSDGNVVLFGHRTSHGGVFRRVDLIEIGAEVDVTVPYGPTRRYQVVNKVLDLPDAIQWADESNTEGGKPTVTLISCAREDGSPGGTARRWFIRAVAI